VCLAAFVRIRTLHCMDNVNALFSASKGGYTLVTLPRTVTPSRGSVYGTRDHITDQKLVTR
jgi:hypothetical protein